MGGILSRYPLGEAKFDLGLHFSGSRIGKFLPPPDQSLAEQFGLLRFSAHQYAIRMTGGAVGFQIAGLNRLGYPHPVFVQFHGQIFTLKEASQTQNKKTGKWSFEPHPVELSQFALLRFKV